jgi:hypothetical protein
MNQRLINETALLLAKELLGIIKGCIRPDEHRDVFEEFFQQCKSGLESYEIQRDRMQKRLRPSLN